MESTADWTECRVALPPLQNWLVLDLATEDPEAWARALADEHLDSAARPEWREAFTADLLWYWGAARRQGALCAALLAPADGAVMASCTVRELRVPPELLSRAALRAEVEQAEGPFFGEQTLDEVDLPSDRPCASTGWNPRTPSPTAAASWRAWPTTCCRASTPRRWSAGCCGRRWASARNWRRSRTSWRGHCSWCEGSGHRALRAGSPSLSGGIIARGIQLNPTANTATTVVIPSGRSRPSWATTTARMST